jgi:DNA repair exonuclease SbcCD ATPase subunit
MSDSRRVLVAVGLVLAMVGLAACAKPPQATIDQAKAALEAAGQAEAATYAGAAWDKAQQSMNAAMAEIEVQAQKFALFRSYKKTNELLATAQQDAAAAQSAAIEGKAAARAAVEQAIAGLEASFAQADAALAALDTCRKRPKGFKADLEIMKGNVDGLRGQLANVQSTAAAEQYLQAKTMAEQLAAQLATVVTDLENARTKLGC